MSYRTDTDAVCELLTKVAQRGYLSEPVKCYSWSDIKRLRCVFTDDEVKTVRAYQAKYARVLGVIRYEQAAVFTAGMQYSAPLIQMISHMLDDPSPDYVMANVQRLQEALESHRSQFASVDFEVEMNPVTA